MRERRNSLAPDRKNRGENSQQSHEIARRLADQWGLEYREAHTLSIDPSAIGIIDPTEARGLGALPLKLGPDGPIFAVAEPSEERFSGVRAAVGENALFVVVAPETLEALMNSKVFNSVSARIRHDEAPVELLSWSRAEPPVSRVEVPEQKSSPGEAAPAETASREQAPATSAIPASGPAVPPAHVTAVPEVEPAHADKPRADQVLASVASLQLTPAERGADQALESFDGIFAQLMEGTANLRAQVAELRTALEASQRELEASKRELEASQRELREAKEQLATAHRINEDHESSVKGLRDELALSRSVADATKSRLRDAIRALEDPGLDDALAPIAAEAEKGRTLLGKRRSS
jgi:hypothetical protein